MSKKPSTLVAARVALTKAEEDLGDPEGVEHLRKAVNAALEVVAGDSPKIEKDIATRLMLSCRDKVLLEAKIVLANLSSCEDATIQYWNDVLEVFVDAGLGEEPEFNTCRERLLATCFSYSAGDAQDDTAGVSIQQMEDDARKENASSNAREGIRPMQHAKALRHIGQSLAMLRLRSFSIRTTEDGYMVGSESLTTVHQWMLKNQFTGISGQSPAPGQESTELTVGDGWLCYRLLDRGAVNAGAGAQTENKHTFQNEKQVDPLAELLHTLGEHLDNKEATEFEVAWTSDTIAVDYQTARGVRERQKFSIKKLQQIASYSMFRKRSRGPAVRSRRDIRP